MIVSICLPQIEIRTSISISTDISNVDRYIHIDRQRLLRLSQTDTHMCTYVLVYTLPIYLVYRTTNSRIGTLVGPKYGTKRWISYGNRSMKTYSVKDIEMLPLSLSSCHEWTFLLIPLIYSSMYIFTKYHGPYIIPKSFTICNNDNNWVCLNTNND